MFGSVGKGQMAAAGKGQAAWQGVWEGRHLWEGQQSPCEQIGNGEPKRDPRFFDNPPGPGLETWGERKSQMPRALACFLLSPDVVGARKSWEAPGGCGEGPTALSVGGERAEGPSSATCFSSISRSFFFWEDFLRELASEMYLPTVETVFSPFPGPL